MLSWLPVSTRLPSGEMAHRGDAGRVTGERHERFLRGDVPDAGRVVFAARDDALAVVARRRRCRHAPLMSFEHVQLFGRSSASHSRAVLSPEPVRISCRRAKTRRSGPGRRGRRRCGSRWPVLASHSLAVWSSLAVRTCAPSGEKHGAVDEAGVAVARELEFGAAGVGVPDFGRVVPTSGDDALAVGREIGRGDDAVRAEAHPLGARCAMSHSRAPLPPTVTKLVAVGREGGGPDLAGF